MNEKVILIGAGGHGLVLANIAKLNGYKDIFFLDDNRDKEYEYKIIGTISEIANYIENYDFFISVGTNSIRKKIFNQLINLHANIVNLIHPSAIIAEDVKLGRGIAVMANSVINSGSVICDGCIINTLSSIDHECITNEFCHISPGCNLAGNVIIGKETWLGIGCSVINNIKICNNSIVGAGSVVVKDLIKIATYAGIPAVIIKEKE